MKKESTEEKDNENLGNWLKHYTEGEYNSYFNTSWEGN